jgi:hypothetical protein
LDCQELAFVREQHPSRTFVKTLVMTPEPGREVCDFCTAGPTYRLYACRNFVWLKRDTLTHESVGAWAACEVCARFVDEGRWAELAERALLQFKKQYGYARSEEPYFREQFLAMHSLFEQHMIKEA